MGFSFNPNIKMETPYAEGQTYTSVNDMGRIPRLSKYQWSGLNSSRPYHPEEKVRAGEYTDMYGNDVYHKDLDFFKPLYENLAWTMGWNPETMNQGIPTTFRTRRETPQEEKEDTVTLGTVNPDYRLPVINTTDPITGYKSDRATQQDTPRLHEMEMIDDKYWDSIVGLPKAPMKSDGSWNEYSEQDVERLKRKTFGHEYLGHLLSSIFANTKQDENGNVFIANQEQNWDASTTGFDRHRGSYGFVPTMRQGDSGGQKKKAFEDQILNNPRFQQTPEWLRAIAHAESSALTDPKWFSGSMPYVIQEDPAYMGNPEEIASRIKAEFLRLKNIERVHRFSQDSKPKITPQTYNAYEKMYSMAPLQKMY